MHLYLYQPGALFIAMLEYMCLMYFNVQFSSNGELSLRPRPAVKWLKVFSTFFICPWCKSESFSSLYDPLYGIVSPVTVFADN